jgi:hypothetical protein
MKGQVFAIILVIMSGVSTFVMFLPITAIENEQSRLKRWQAIF